MTELTALVDNRGAYILNKSASEIIEGLSKAEFAGMPANSKEMIAWVFRTPYMKSIIKSMGVERVVVSEYHILQSRPHMRYFNMSIEEYANELDKLEEVKK